MKKALPYLLIVAVGVFSFATMGFMASKEIEPSKTMETKTLDIGNVYELEVDQVNVKVTPGKSAVAKLTAPSNLINLIEVKNDAGDLTVKLKEGVQVKGGKLNATLELTANLHDVEANLASVVTFLGPLKAAKTVGLEASTAGGIEVPSVECPQLDIEVSTAGGVEVGTANISDKIDIETQTAGGVKIANAYCKRFVAESYSGSAITVEKGRLGRVSLEAYTGSGISIGKSVEVSGGSAESYTGASISCPGNVSKE